MSAPSNTPHARVLIGLVAGAALGCAVNSLTAPPPAPPDLAPALSAVIGGAIDPADLAAALGRRPKWVEYSVEYAARPVGTIFLNLLFMAIIPLVFASLALGVTRLGGGSNLGRVGLKTVAYFVVTTTVAACIGLGLVNLVRPGEQLPEAKRDQLMTYYSGRAKAATESAAFGLDTFLNIVPKNPLKSLVEPNMLAVIFTAIIVGIALTRIEPERAQLLVKLLEGVNEVADFIIRLAMRMAPYAVFALIYSTTALFGFDLLRALGAFILTVLGGLAIHLLIVLPILVATLGGTNPVTFFQRARGTIATAFSTSSSSATLPTAMRCAEDELGVPERVSRFVLPLSASMNHNGTALFEGVTVIFLAQAFGHDLPLTQQLVVLLMCVLTATGMAGVPGGSLPLIGLVLGLVGVEPQAIAIVLGVDRILDMCRTAVNVTADLTTAVFVARGEGNELGARMAERGTGDGAK